MVTKRRALTPKEIATAERAKALWVSKKKAEKLSQADAAEALGMSASAFNQYINGVIPFNTDATLIFARYFGVGPGEINSEWFDDFEAEGVGEQQSQYFAALLEVIDDDQAIEEIRAVLSRVSPKGALAVARLFLDRAEDGLEEK